MKEYRTGSRFESLKKARCKLLCSPGFSDESSLTRALTLKLRNFETATKTGNPRGGFPKLHDAAQELVMLAQLQTYARAAVCDPSIVTPAGG